MSVEGKGALSRKWAALMHVLGDRGGAPGDRVLRDAQGHGVGGGRALRARASRAVAYHAGMDPQERRDSQAAFMEDRAEVVVATNAFGMGVDKANVRTVAHWALPTSLEAYYQEAGQRRTRWRAGARAAARRRGWTWAG